MPHDLKPYLVRCGYRADLLVEDYEYLKTDGESASIPLLAFADQPTDARSACIAVLAGNGSNESAVRSTASTGAPYALVATPDEVQWWLNRRDEPKLNERVPIQHLDQFFDANKANFDPDRVFRAKTLGSLDQHEQLTFVDAGLMPMVEGEIGERLSSLVGRVVKGMLTTLGKGEPTPPMAAKVFRIAFWLLAGKMLRDKRVPSFKTLDVTSIEDVFDRVGRHYGVPESPPSGGTWTRAAQRAAAEIASFATLANVSTESLGYLYESTMVPPHVRKALGIHSTPAYLIDYMVWQMADWFAELPEENRHVFEPACGHGGFLVASVRLLRELLGNVDARYRTKYLRSHIHGLEIDPFAIEIARLSLTLADIPNPNGWQLTNDDMFSSAMLEKQLRRSGIVLANPPFENFSSTERNSLIKQGSMASANKAGELLRRIVRNLPTKSAFGVVIPQTLLYGKSFASTRRELLANYELREVCLFPDKVFSFADSESAILLGRRRSPNESQFNRLHYRVVRDGAIDSFKNSYTTSSSQSIPQSRMADEATSSMRVPELDELWQYMSSYESYDTIAAIGQGLIYHGKELPDDAITVSPRKLGGFKAGFDLVPSDWQLHELPPQVWLNHDPALIRRWVSGAWTGKPQVILNYARVSRGPWRLKAGLDLEGHAVSSRFLVVRPAHDDISPKALWAISVSPLANAFVYCHTMKRDITAGLMRSMPVPSMSSGEQQRLNNCVDEYFASVKADLQFQTLSDHDSRNALVQIDSEVLKLYDLPPRLERQLLDLFEGQQRSGVPFRFDSYYPTGVKASIPLHRLLSEDISDSTAGRLRLRRRPLKPGTIQSALDLAASSFEEG